MSFAYPWLLLLSIPAIFVAWRILRAKRSGGVMLAGASMSLAHHVIGWRYAVTRLLPWCFVVGLFALILAAAGPRTALSREVRSADALAVMMTVDLSGSMNALDLCPKKLEKTRLDFVKETFKAFVEKRPDDMIGLVTFGGYAATRVPLTADHEALLHTLSGVEIPTIQGYDDKGRPVSNDELMTAIGDGLATALARIQNAEPKTKVVILLSDGENNAGVVSPKDAAQAAQKMGVKVYTIGVGKTGVAPFRMVDHYGRRSVHRQRMVLDEATLRDIATQSGGEYYNVTSPDALARALEAINQLETTHIDREVYYRYNDHFAPYLIGGVAAVLVALTGLMLLTKRPI